MNNDTTPIQFTADQINALDLALTNYLDMLFDDMHDGADHLIETDTLIATYALLPTHDAPTLDAYTAELARFRSIIES